MLALIAGRGRLPAILAERLAAEGRPFLRCELEGVRSDLPGPPDAVFRLETLGGLLATLRARGVTALCLAGAVSRPRFDPAALDAETAPLVAPLRAALGAGDDGALRAILAILSGAGFGLVAAQELAPDLLPLPGLLGRVAPGPGLAADLARAQAILAALGPADIGQGCVVAGGQALALEALPGTDWMLASLRPALGTPAAAPGDPFGLFSPDAGGGPAAGPAMGPGLAADTGASATRGAGDHERSARWQAFGAGAGSAAEAGPPARPGTHARPGDAADPGAGVGALQGAPSRKAPGPPASGAAPRFEPDQAARDASWAAGLPALRAARPAHWPCGGLLFKAPKAGQDRRADLPAIGPATIVGAAEAGLEAVAIEEGGVLVLDRARTVALADAAGLALLVHPSGGAGASGHGEAEA